MARPPKLDREPCNPKQLGCFQFGQTRKIELIDLSKIPEAPPGSDADKVAKGEMSDR